MIALQELLRPPTDFGHAWAYGCPECRFGLCNPPQIHSSQPLYIQRAVQAHMGDITFCHCQAGTTYRTYLQGVWERLQGPGSCPERSEWIGRLQERIRDETATAVRLR